MRTRPAALLAVLLLTVGVACSVTESEPPPGPPSTEAAALPLLAPGGTLGTTLYGGADLPAPSTPERAVLDTGIDRGLNGFTYYVDWVDLEPEPDRYKLEAFTVLSRAREERYRPRALAGGVSSFKTSMRRRAAWSVTRCSGTS
jgi:hypothetical protein